MTALLYGLMAEFADAAQLVTAVEEARRSIPDARIDAYAPLPIAALEEARQANALPRWVLAGAVLGGIGTFALEWYSAVIDYPLNIGGRPTGSWLAFLPPALEMTLLGAAVFGVFAWLMLSHLPHLHHPLFAEPAFERATSDRFFLVVRATCADFDARQVRAVLEGLGPVAVTEVAP